MLLLLVSACLVDESLYREVKADFRDLDGDGYTPRAGDCDDENVGVAPGLPETCDGLDNDCDGVVDEDPQDQLWYEDADGDGFGSPLVFLQECESPGAGFTIDPGDCDDTDAEIHPGATELCDDDDVDEDCDGTADNGDAEALGRRAWYADADGDSFGDPADSQNLCDQPAGYADDAEDCDDGDGDVWPGQIEVCNDKDDDCDGGVDVDPTDGVVYFADEDGDEFGDPLDFVVSCVAMDDRVADGTDCDDQNAAVNPAEVEVCDPNQRDEDCDTLVDDGDSSATGQTVFFGDSDGDGHGISGTYVVSCDPPIGYGVGTDDCDDEDATRYPGGVEMCDELDSDCDGSLDDTDAVDAESWYADDDGDGFGTTIVLGQFCDRPEGSSSNSVDCDDSRADAWPGAAEVCDSLDNDCNGVVDDGAAAESVWFMDVDGDGFGDAASAGCPSESGYVALGGDCDDADPDVSPGAVEVCSDAEVDEDCDGRVDDGDASVAGTSVWYADADGDGHGDAATAIDGCRALAGWVAVGDDCFDADASIGPDRYEVCNGVDDDCDGTVDVGAVVGTPGYADVDGDGFGGASEACDGISTGGDCDDGDPTIFPGAARGSDGRDHDCDGAADSELVQSYVDEDADGWGTGVATWVASGAAGYSPVDGDCDDVDAAVNPGAAEVCRNGLDDDCSGDDNDCLRAGTYTTDEADAWFDAPNETFLDGSVGYFDYRMFAWPGVDFDGDGADDIVGGGHEVDLSGDHYRVYSGFPETFDASWLEFDSAVAPRRPDTTALVLGGDPTADTTLDVLVVSQAIEVNGGVFLYSWGGGEPNPSSHAAFMAGPPNPGFGLISAAVGDVDGDGTDDVLLASEWSNGTGTAVGAVLAWEGPLSGEYAASDAAIALTGDTTNAGTRGLAACDLDGDGLAEWFVGAPHVVPYDRGRVFAFSGLDVTNMADADYTWDGETDHAQAGYWIGCVGESTDPILVVGAPNPDHASGVYGSTHLINALGSGSATLSSVAWLTIRGNDDDDEFGTRAAAGRLDDDDSHDLVIGAPGEGSTASAGGAAYIFYAPAGGALDAADADATIIGIVDGEGTGRDVSTGDVDGDGDDDILLSSSGSGAWTSTVGRASLWRGGTR